MSEIERLAIVAANALHCRICDKTVRGDLPIKCAGMCDLDTPTDADVVRAILQAMREPSEGVVDAGRQHGSIVTQKTGACSPYERCLLDREVLPIWQAMIDHLLAE